MVSFSIVIPIYNEELSIKDLIDEIFKSLENIKQRFELIIIDDASNDNTSNIISLLKKKYDFTYKKNKVNQGQSYSILQGIKLSKYITIVTMDGDGQNNPNNIMTLLDVYGEINEYHLVAGIRNKRQDSFLKKISSRIANKVRSYILKDHCSDTGCSLKVFNKNYFIKMPYFDSIHRFIPSLFEANNLSVIYIPVDHRPRLKGKSKYGTFDRLFKGVIDLYKVYRLINR